MRNHLDLLYLRIGGLLRVFNIYGNISKPSAFSECHTTLYKQAPEHTIELNLFFLIQTPLFLTFN